MSRLVAIFYNAETEDPLDGGVVESLGLNRYESGNMRDFLDDLWDVDAGENGAVVFDPVDAEAVVSEWQDLYDAEAILEDMPASFGLFLKRAEIHVGSGLGMTITWD